MIIAVVLFVLLTRQGALVSAAGGNDLAGVKFWASMGANLDRGCDHFDSSVSWPPLMIAARQGNNEVVRYLLARGANPNIRGMRNPLIAACSQRHYETAKILLEHGADPNARGEGTPLEWAEGLEQPEAGAA